MDTDLAVDLVRKDVAAGVGQWLPAVDGADLEIGVTGQGARPDGAPFVTVQWIHRGRNEGADDPFVGLAPTGAEVEVHGVTLVEDRGDDEPLFHRYVDWVGTFDQLGLAVSARLPVSERPRHIG
jgi:hypothetical protein